MRALIHGTRDYSTRDCTVNPSGSEGRRNQGPRGTFPLPEARPLSGRGSNAEGRRYPFLMRSSVNHALPTDSVGKA